MRGAPCGPSPIVESIDRLHPEGCGRRCSCIGGSEIGVYSGKYLCEGGPGECVGAACVLLPLAEIKENAANLALDLIAFMSYL